MLDRLTACTAQIFPSTSPCYAVVNFRSGDDQRIFNQKCFSNFGYSGRAESDWHPARLCFISGSYRQTNDEMRARTAIVGPMSRTLDLHSVSKSCGGYRALCLCVAIEGHFILADAASVCRWTGPWHQEAKLRDGALLKPGSCPPNCNLLQEQPACPS